MDAPNALYQKLEAVATRAVETKTLDELELYLLKMKVDRLESEARHYKQQWLASGVEAEGFREIARMVASRTTATTWESIEEVIAGYQATVERQKHESTSPNSTKAQT